MNKIDVKPRIYIFHFLNKSIDYQNHYSELKLSTFNILVKDKTILSFNST